MRSLSGPLLVAVVSQVGAAYLDGALRWGTLAAIAIAVYHAWRQNRWEEQERQRIGSAMQTAPPLRRARAEWWPKDW